MLCNLILTQSLKSDQVITFDLLGGCLPSFLPTKVSATFVLVSKKTETADDLLVSAAEKKE